MSFTSTATGTYDLKVKLEAAARIAHLAAADPRSITYSWGEPDSWSDDIVMFMRTTSVQEPATYGTPRTRNETLTCDIHFMVFRTAQRDAEDRAYELLALLERYVRVTDTHLDSSVLWCFMTEHEAEGFALNDSPSGRRGIEIRATFTAYVRISG
jgi:hypothetical protein